MKQIQKNIRKRNSMYINNTGHCKWVLGTEAPSTGRELRRKKRLEGGG